MRNPCTCHDKTPCPACAAYQTAHRRLPGERGPGKPLGAHARRLEQYHTALVAAYRAGAPLTALARQYGAPADTVTEYLKRHGVWENRVGSNQYRLRRGDPHADH